MKLSILQTIARDRDLSTFSRYLLVSGAGKALEGNEDLTVFAPTNLAFRKIPEEQINALLTETGQVGLRSLLASHILSGIHTASSVGELALAKSITGSELNFTVDGGLKVNGSTVEARDLEATDGLIHTIDTVMPLPKTSGPGS
jgi:uncharacterized surface protein with fasciclin (FAS1) repeats